MDLGGSWNAGTGSHYGMCKDAPATSDFPCNFKLLLML
jgi:hypothetical protein